MHSASLMQLCVIGDLVEAVAGVVSQYCPTPVMRIGMQDVFGEYGQAQEFMDKYGLRARNIVEAAEKIFHQFYNDEK